MFICGSFKGGIREEGEEYKLIRCNSMPRAKAREVANESRSATSRVLKRSKSNACKPALAKPVFIRDRPQAVSDNNTHVTCHF